jgi:CheY-like chemotaxis protein
MSTKTVLVIEDNVQNMYMTTFLLEKSGFKVVQARDGQEGLARAAEVEPDLILLDIQLPLMDGYEVARRLKSNIQTGAIPLVAVTSYAMAGDREAVFRAGCEGYIEKPIDPETFVRRVSSFLPPP